MRGEKEFLRGSETQHHRTALFSDDVAAADKKRAFLNSSKKVEWNFLNRIMLDAKWIFQRRNARIQHARIYSALRPEVE